MKKIFRFLVIGVFALGCTAENDVEPASEKTFVRYLGSEHNNVAVLAQEVPGGFALLSYSEIAGTTVGEVNYQVKFILLDESGNWKSEKNYPETPAPEDPVQNFHMKASSFIPVSSGGYLIIGEGMNANGTTKIQLIMIDENGDPIAFNSISDPLANISLRGSAVVEHNGDFVVLGKVTGDVANDMMVARISGAALLVDRPTEDLPAGPSGVIWTRKYGAGLSTLISRLDQNAEANNDFFWAGSVQNSASLKNDIRLIRMLEDSQVPPGGRPIGEADVDEVAFDFCRLFSGYAITGSTTKLEENVTANANGNIYVLRVNTESEVIFRKQLAPFEPEEDLKDEGVSIDQTENQNLVILANVGTTTKQQDLLVVKLDASGKELWRHDYGNSEKQEGASIRQTSDGFLVFATTYFGNVKKLMLLKLNEDGKL
jgi:hypothetical protein